MKKIFLSVLASVFIMAWYTPKAQAQAATTPVHSSGGPSGAAHRLPHDIAFSQNPSIVQNTARTTLTNWVNNSMKRMVCAEAFNTQSGARARLGCALLSFDVGTKHEFNVPLGNLPTGTHRLVYTYQDAGGFWHQVTNTSDRLVATTFTVR